MEDTKKILLVSLLVFTLPRKRFWSTDTHLNEIRQGIDLFIDALSNKKRFADREQMRSSTGKVEENCNSCLHDRRRKKGLTALIKLKDRALDIYDIKWAAIETIARSGEIEKKQTKEFLEQLAAGLT